ncbi:MAG: valine--tRNA ligase [Candidatus Hadarchaeota archaeon]
MSLPKDYSAGDIEEKWQKKWDEWELFRFDKDSEKPIFSIDTPPRYASGDLHMGHAKNYLEFEIVARAMRLLGYNVFFPVGYDDNGLPTERYVEEELGIKREDVGREKFIEKCMDASEKLEKKMTEIYDRIGMSWDWDTFYRTIGDRAMETAQRSFLELYEDGRLYRRDEPTLWCPYHETSLAQATVEDKERNTILNYLYFELEDGDKIEIATTRPELLPSCVAVFVHPGDERYKDLVGKTAKVPLFNYEVPIMEAEEVDPEFGSGIVMVCTFGDNTDVEMWRKYDLPLKISIDKKGRMNELAGVYEGLSIKEAQEKIIDDLKRKDVIFDQEDLHQTVGVCWRCETPVEFIPTKQWFVETLDQKVELIEQGNEIDWYPEYYEQRYIDWVRNLKWDWCISRQRAYGVPFPIWYCEDCGNVVVAEEEDLPIDPRGDDYRPERCDECESENIEPEEDVMDTWMTSSLTPQIAGKWKEDEEFFEKIFPMSLRPQSHDIIRTWAFYTILKAYFHNNSIPWEDIMISGYVYTEEGVGMSSSKGTGVSPEGIIEEYGADVLRYWSGGAGTGEDIVYQEKEVVRGNKLLRKIWNASRFVGMHIENYDPDLDPELETEDVWILTKLDRVLRECEDRYRNYSVSKVIRSIENFFKGEFCDNYLEMVKHRLYEPEEYGEESRHAAIKTLYMGLLASLKAFAPIIPHITEELYQELFREYEGDLSIHKTNWPEIDENYLDEDREKLGELARDIIAGIRKWKSDNGIPLNRDLTLVELSLDPEAQTEIEKVMELIKGAINIREMEISSATSGEVEVEIENWPLKVKRIVQGD